MNKILNFPCRLQFNIKLLNFNSYNHLWNNLQLQVIIGGSLESVHGWKRVARIYLASVLGGTMFVTVLSNSSYSCGASGGLYGLIFSHAAAITLNWYEIDRPFLKLFCWIFFVATAVGQTIYEELIVGETSDVSHAGHLGGAVIGFLVSILAVKCFRKHRWGDSLQEICIGSLVTIFVFIFIYNVAASEAFLPTEWNFKYEESYYGNSLATNEIDDVIDAIQLIE